LGVAEYGGGDRRAQGLFGYFYPRHLPILPQIMAG
jgi:hypothetical protein